MVQEEEEAQAAANIKKDQELDDEEFPQVRNIEQLQQKKFDK